MSKLVVIDFGSGNLETGFVNITARLETRDRQEQFTGSLPPDPDAIELYRNWQSIYNQINNRIAIRSRLQADDDDDFEIDFAATTNISNLDLQQASQQLEKHFQNWLKSEGFLDLERRLRTELDPDDSFAVIIETKNDLIRKLPWHVWDSIDRDYPKAEIVLSRLEYKRVAKQIQTNKDTVRILSVLGYADDLEVEKDWQILASLKDEQIEDKTIELEALSNPSRKELDSKLWDKSGWDIFFFSGHSRTEGESGSIRLSENEIITIEQLKYALKTAIENGLQLAIFNSCDGLGLANALSKLDIPEIIVMREPVPDRVAQQFFKYFMQAFAIEQKPLYLAVRQAREKLQALEDEYPGVTYLPITFQNPAVEPLTWWQLAKICPYKDLQAFREKDAHLFFGREKVTSELVEKVKSKPLVTIIGASGSGKSSVLFAGVISDLKREQSKRWQIASFRPQDNPFDSLIKALAPLLSELLISDEERRLSELNLDIDRTALSRLIAKIATVDRPLLIAIDQFEELYTLCPDRTRQSFLDMLVEAVTRAQENKLNFSLILTLRADFLDNCLAYSPFVDILQNIGIQYLLGQMSRLELKAAIEKPARQFGVTLEPGLIEDILYDVKEDPGNLPLLEFALTQLWQEQSDFCLSHRAYQKIGGVENALTNHADRVYRGLTEAEKQLARRIFIQLVKPARATEATRRIATRVELGEDNWHLVRRLAGWDARLVVTNRDEFTGMETVEVVHEALIKNWGRLSQWFEANRKFRLWQERLRETIKQWENQAKDEGLLLRGKSLKRAKTYLEKRQDELSQIEQDYIFSSIKFNARQRNIKYTSIAAFVLLVAALPISWRLLKKTEIIAGNEMILSVPILENHYKQINSQHQIEKNQLDKEYFYELNKNFTITELNTIHNHYRERSDKIHDLLANYRLILRSTIALKKELEKEPEKFSDREANLINKIHHETEEYLAQLILTYRIPELELYLKDFKNINPNKRESIINNAKKITQEICLNISGVGADLNGDGYVHNEEEAQLIPKKVLKRIGNLWHHYTEGDCYWHGNTGHFNHHYFADDNCREILGPNNSTLTRLMSEPPYSQHFLERLKEAKINKPARF